MANDFYTSSTSPTTNSQGSSAVIRAEFASIQAGFDKMPTVTGNGDKLISVNTAGTALEAIAAATALARIGAQPLDAALTSIAALGTAADKMIYTTGVNVFAETAITVAGRALLDDADAATQRATLGLGTMATQASGAVAITGGTGAFSTLSASGLITATGGQIAFPATAVPSAGANVLDDYEEGTWTPTDASGAGLTFLNIIATYEKIGRQVTCRAVFDFPVTADASFNRISGFPFTISSGSVAVLGYSNNAAAGNSIIVSGTTITIADKTTKNQMANSALSAAITNYVFLSHI